MYKISHITIEPFSQNFLISLSFIVFFNKTFYILVKIIITFSAFIIRPTPPSYIIKLFYLVLSLSITDYSSRYPCNYRIIRYILCNHCSDSNNHSISNIRAIRYGYIFSTNIIPRNLALFLLKPCDIFANHMIPPLLFPTNWGYPHHFGKCNLRSQKAI